MGFEGEDEEKEEDQVMVMVRLSATTTDSRGTTHKISRILHTLHFNTVDNSTMSYKAFWC